MAHASSILLKNVIGFTVLVFNIKQIRNRVLLIIIFRSKSETEFSPEGAQELLFCWTVQFSSITFFKGRVLPVTGNS